MRFLFGIFLGAGLTLLLATAVDAPTSPLVEQLRGGWQRVLELTGDALFRQRAPEAPPKRQAEQQAEVAGLAPEAETLPSATKPGVPDLAEAREALSARAAEELEQLARVLAPERSTGKMPERIPGPVSENVTERAPEPVTPPEPVATAGVSSRADSEADASLALTAGEAPIEPTEVLAPFKVPGTGDENVASVASVWVPFHSEMSARGFARRLTAQLDHPFEVQREHAGAYSVVFSYADPAQRDALLSEVQEITGR